MASRSRRSVSPTPAQTKPHGKNPVEGEPSGPRGRKRCMDEREDPYAVIWECSQPRERDMWRPLDWRWFPSYVEDMIRREHVPPLCCLPVPMYTHQQALAAHIAYTDRVEREFRASQEEIRTLKAEIRELHERFSFMQKSLLLVNPVHDGLAVQVEELKEQMEDTRQTVEYHDEQITQLLAPPAAPPAQAQPAPAAEPHVPVIIALPAQQAAVGVVSDDEEEEEEEEEDEEVDSEDDGSVVIVDSDDDI